MISVTYVCTYVRMYVTQTIAPPPTPWCSCRYIEGSRLRAAGLCKMVVRMHLVHTG